ncbi:MAG: right-handed parallel beta-helix repeat-containing protein [Candidatus Thorarchaeota archaeon]
MVLVLTILPLSVVGPAMVGTWTTRKSSGAGAETYAIPAVPSAYTQVQPIRITSDADFAANGWSGSGTAEDPHVLANIIVANWTTCIVIANINAHFVLHDVVITGEQTNNAIGMKLENVTNGLIANVSVSGMTLGTSVLDCGAIEFSNCSTSDLTCTGIYIYYSMDIVVSSSRIQGPLHMGISTDTCDNVAVVDTTVTDPA